MAKIKGVDLLATLAADLEKTEADAEARRQARTAAIGTTNGLLHLPLDAIEPDPDQPRRISGMRDEDDPHGLEDLAGSILAHGVIQPITVRPLGQGRYRIVTGERRWRAAQIALQSGQPCQRKGYDLARISAVLVAPESATDQLEMQMVENLARADMTPLDTAQALQKLLDATGVSMRELARRLGRSLGWVQQILTVASPEALEISRRIGVPLEAIGPRDLMSMKTWLADGRQAILDTVRARIAGGETYSRSLIDEEADRYELETSLNLQGRSFSLSDLRLLKSWQGDPEKAAPLSRVQGGMGISDALAASSTLADNTVIAQVSPVEEEPEQGQAEEAGDEEDGESVPASWNEDRPVVVSEQVAAATPEDDSTDTAPIPNMDIEPESQGHISAFTVQLPGDLIVQIFEKGGLPLPQELDTTSLLDALRNALAICNA
ncbi:MAG: ParB/RepB/Spo0J family partition protein [Acidithiobacillus sp.]|nr:ParB/RepB/Spo0J family partition protein [Acidithiobacillus sp.]